MLLVVALQGASGWQCEQDERGLWNCQGATPPAPAAQAPVTPPTPEPEAMLPETIEPEPEAAPLAPEPMGPDPFTPIEQIAPESAAARATVPVAEPEAQSVEPESPVPEVDGYVVQIGAFRTRERAKEAAAEIDDDNLIIMPTRREEGEWYVLLLGTFADYAAAEAAGEAYRTEYPQGTYWVRSAVELRGVLPQARSVDPQGTADPRE